MKRIISLILTFAMLIGMLPMTAWAAEIARVSTIDTVSTDVENTCGKTMYWSFDQLSGTLSISGTGKMYNYDSIDELTTAPWAEFADEIVRVIVSDGIEYIGREAFVGCKQLSEVFLPASVTELGNEAFFRCIGMESIDLPDNLEKLGQFTFFDSGLTHIKIPNSITEIDYGTFYYCEKLTSVDLPNGLKIIDNSAFAGCTNLTEIAIPKNVTSIGSSAFADCEKITSIAIPDGVTQIESNTFGGCTGLSEISIGNNVESIQENAFNQCWSLTKVEFGDKLTNIESRGFFNCCSLTELKFTGNAPAIASFAFFEVTATAYYPANNTTWNESVFQNYNGNLTWLSYEDNSEESGGTHTHSYGDWYQTMAPTQDAEGEERRDCTGCNYYETRILAKLPDLGDTHEHHYTSTITEPTCTEQGFTTYTCDCDDSYVDNYVDAIGHAYNDGEITTEPRCETAGIKTFTCSNNPEHYYTEEVAAVGHSFGAWYETKAPTQEEEGEEQRDCSNCDHFETRTKEKLLPDNVAEGTCGENLTWTLNDGILTISGTGSMWDYESSEAPWFDLYKEIAHVIVEDGVSYIGSYAFEYRYPHNYTSIFIPKSVIAIAPYALSFEHAYYNGTEEAWKQIDNASNGASTIHFNHGYFEGGVGSPIDPYWVKNAEQLNAVRYDLTANYVQMADIDLTGIEWRPIGNGNDRTDTGNSFGGSYNGNGFKITNMTILDPEYRYIGLFGVNVGVIKNIILEDINISISLSGTVEDRYNYDGFTSATIGGVAGCSDYLYGPKISSVANCTVSGKIEANSAMYSDYGGFSNGLTIGGIIGVGACKNCTNYADISAVASGDGPGGPSSSVYCGGITVGGIALSDEFYVVENCVNYGNISAVADNGATAGGIVGQFAPVRNCVNFGDILSQAERTIRSDFYYYNTSGGIVGAHRTSLDYCENCVNFGNVKTIFVGSDAGCIAGGIVGFVDYSSSIWGKSCYSNCYNLASMIHADSTKVDDDTMYTYVGAVWGAIDTEFPSADVINCYTVDSVKISNSIYRKGYDGQDLSAEEINLKIKDIMLSLGLPWDENVGEDEEEETDSKESNTVVRYFNSWDAENQIAYFGNEELNFDMGHWVTEETDKSFLTNVDSLVGTYVLARTRVEVIGAVSRSILLSIEPLETKTAKITAIGDDGTITFDNGESYTIPQNLGQMTVSVGDTVMYHLYEGKLVGINGTGSVGGKEDDEEKPEEDPKPTDEYMIEVYAIERNLSIKPGQELQLLCALYHNGELMPDWNGLSWGTPDGDIIEVSHYDRVDSGYRLFIKGLREGQARFNLTDGNLNTSISLDIRVSNHNATPFGCTIDNVPSRNLDEFGDEGTQVNFYNINGMFVSDFWKSEKQSNGKYTVKFNVYSRNYMHGSVDVYDANDNWIGSQRIDKKQNVRGVLDTAYKGMVTIGNAFAGKALSYKAPTYTKKTKIEIEVPEGGRFTISNNIAASPGAFLYNTIDLYCQILGESSDLLFKLGGNSESTIKSVQDLTIEKLIADPSFNKTFQKEIANFTINASADATKRGYVDTVSGLVDTMLKYAGDIVLSAFSSVMGMTESTLLDLIPKEVTIWFDILFAVSKITDVIGQGIDLCRSSDKSYIVIYTPEIGDKMTVQGVTVVPGQSALPEYVYLNVSRVPTSEPLTIPDLNVDTDEYQLYDISFTSNGMEIQPDGTVTIYMPIPTNVDWQSYLVLHQKSDGTWEKLESHIEDGNIVVEVGSFSLFAIVEEERKLQKLGDVTGDGKVTATDYSRLLAHVKKVSLITDADALWAADVTGDGKITATDYSRLLAHVKKVAPLW